MDLGQEVYVGLDTHRETITGAVMDKSGLLICNYKFQNTPEALTEFFKDFRPWSTNIALEACNFWRGVRQTLEKYGYKVRLANPVKCRQIAKEKKTDKIDARDLANLMRVGYLPEVWVPSKETLELRDLTRHRCNLVRLKVRIQNKIKAYLSREGIAYEKNLWNNKGIEWLKSLENDKVNDFIKLYELLAKEESAVKKKINRVVRMKSDISLLNTIPGIGETGAALIYAEIGDINRFRDVKNLHAYAGLAPGIYQSGTKTRMPHRREINYWLKWILGQCSGRSTLIQGKLQKYYFKVREKKGWKTARKATARKLLTIVWHVLKEKIPYHES